MPLPRTYARCTLADTPNPVGLGKYLKRCGIADAIRRERETAAMNVTT